MNEKLRRLAKGTTGKLLREVLLEAQQKVADIRTPLKVKPDIENEVRLGIIEAIDVLLLEPLLVAGGNYEPQDPNEFV
jgi:hypothetical protein